MRQMGAAVFETIAASVLAAAGIGAAAWLPLPIRNKAERRRLSVTSDHGLVIRTYPNSDAMGGLGQKDLLGAEPGWLADTDFYFRDGLPAQAPPARQSEWAAWARDNGGEPVGWRHILIHIQATQDRSVLLRKPVTKVKRAEVVGGVVLSPFQELGGNGLMVRQFHIELDDDPVQVEYFPEGGPQAPQFTMAKGATEAFVVIAHAARGRYEWSLDIPVLVDGVEFVLRADDEGQPFVSVGSADIEAQRWRFDQKDWQSAEW